MFVIAYTFNLPGWSDGLEVWDRDEMRRIVIGA